ncbi:metallophosphoesterase family protein [Bauldia sp.]|uniref:metallophosphoesterase family protein n=1 Tax=Bauldia sp. TaxID=2575872 RepID=UPI003BAD9F1C
MFLGESAIPDGLRIYAIGDIHGCDAMLAEAHERIARDLAGRPVADHRIFHLGDYVDRGPDSAGVLARLSALQASDSRFTCLRGNHDTWLLEFLSDPQHVGPSWLTYGGVETLASYGIDAARPDFTGRGLSSLSARLAAVFPPEHRRFLEACALTAQVGDYFFCHAGIRPGVPLAEQIEDDIIWIREPFLSDRRDHGVIVIHGHTPAPQPEIKPNRINIDSGAVFGGPMTVLALEGRQHHFLS